MKKRLVAFFMPLLVLVLAACSGTVGQWYDQYSLDTERITIWYGSADYQSIDITDAAQIAGIVEAVDFAAWEPLSADQLCDGIFNYYIDFHNGTVIGIYCADNDGNVGLKKAAQQYSVPEYASAGFYRMAPTLRPVVEQLVQEQLADTTAQPSV